MTMEQQPQYNFAYGGGIVSAESVGHVKFMLFVLGDLKETPIWEVKKSGMASVIQYYYDTNIPQETTIGYQPSLPAPLLPQQTRRIFNYWTMPYRLCKLFVSQETKTMRFHHSFFFLIESPKQYTARIEIGMPPTTASPLTAPSPPTFRGAFAVYDMYFVVYGRFLTRKEVLNVVPPHSLTWKLYQAQKRPSIEYLKQFVKVTLPETAADQVARRRKSRMIRPVIS